ncbi:SDR family oxidoreductase [Pseudosporangium ferrugineum]|uniref:SDR family oxidoreductase n=1 Tax=Pseudosporangium ferrugineum TaxID=439699 RepID=UPI000D05B550|nr:SDR family oxidoreductase [Pseudosporangium ferrugineum]
MTVRTAFVGGGSGGIGRATAEALARSGHRVAIAGRHAGPLTATAAELSGLTGRPVHPVVADLRDPASAEAAVGEVTGRFGALDVLVLNAGGPPPGRVLDVGDGQWLDAFDLLVRGPLRYARLALPAMAARGFGRVIVVTSTAVRQPQPDLAASVVLRAAVTAAAKLLSLEYADRGVTVNCVAPGPTATARRHEVLAARARRTGETLAGVEAADVASVPAGRPGDPAEIAAAVDFLASAAAGFVNGTVLTVDGGRTETI